MKICGKCGLLKDSSLFYKDCSTSDGLKSICISCKKDQAKKYYKNNTELCKDKAQQWKHMNPEKNKAIYTSYRLANPDKVKQSNKNARMKRRDSSQKYDLERKKLFPEKLMAKYLVRKAIRKGMLIKESCKICGKKYVHAHHQDYSKPLDVIWLCPSHHKKIHLGTLLTTTC
jgi:hypothetical protein